MITPFPFFEGSYTDRLDYLADLPPGKILGLFDSTDIFKAKQKLGKVMCMSGMMPLSLLQTGSHEDIKTYTRTLIDVVGKDGGFIMGPRSAMDECDPARVKVWVDYTREYGVYR
jgi:uroporphyrinogen-III decarboxylase